MKNYVSIVDAMEDLRSRGYTADFDFNTNTLKCPALELELHPDDFEIVETYRFEGDTNPDDSSVLYAISGREGLKGVLIDAYGAYATQASAALLAKLPVKH